MSSLITFSSYNTEQNRSYWLQQQVDGFPRIPRIIVGYLFVKEMTEIKIFVAYPNGKLLQTCYLMPDQSSEVFQIYTQPVQPQEIIEEERGFTAKPRKAAAKRGQQ